MCKRGENIYKRKDGRWEGRYIQGRKENGSIQYGYVYSHSYSELRQQLLTYKVIYKENYAMYNKKSRSIMTFERWALIWLTKQETKVRPNTYQSYRSKLERHLLPALGSQDLAAINSKKVQKVIDQLFQKLAASSVRAIIRVLRTCLNEAIKAGILQHNAVDDLQLPETPHSSVKAFEKNEQKVLENKIKEKILEKPNLYLPGYLALYTGLRIGEIAGLQWQDINWRERTLSIRRNIQRVKLSDNCSELKITPLKTRSSYRVIPLSNQLYHLLKKLEQISSSEFIFHGRDNGPMDTRTIRYHFSQIRRQVEITKLPFHALRHTFATRCIESGVPITTVSALLGHQSIKMTLDTYTSSFLTEKRFAIDQLEIMRP